MKNTETSKYVLWRFVATLFVVIRLSDGCPILKVKTKEIKMTECGDMDHCCPSSTREGTFRSDDLYKYPSCLELDEPNSPCCSSLCSTSSGVKDSFISKKSRSTLISSILSSWTPYNPTSYPSETKISEKDIDNAANSKSSVFYVTLGPGVVVVLFCAISILLVLKTRRQQMISCLAVTEEEHEAESFSTNHLSGNSASEGYDDIRSVGYTPQTMTVHMLGSLDFGNNFQSGIAFENEMYAGGSSQK